jgi:DNA-directed RNA polymerase sigma subunit (sigma70/sigma32)
MKLTKKQRDEQTLKIVGNHLGFSTKRISQSFKLLSEIEKIVLSSRFGVEPAKVYTIIKMGQDFELDMERICQMEAKALKKLRRGITCLTRTGRTK